MTLADLGLIGNCQISALVRRDGAIVWACMPRFDSPPVFGALLDEEHGGRFSICSASNAPGVQRYLANSNVLETRFESPDGAFRVLDFAPRFMQFDRSFRPTQLIRIVEPLSGTPSIRVRCNPIRGWERTEPRRDVGSHHIAFHDFGTDVRLTTDASLSYMNGEPFALTQRRHFVFSWGAPVEEPLPELCERFLLQTVRYWQLWVKHCDIPPIYQEEVIRSALALKLQCFEDTGAIIAAPTTSIPEAPGSGRTWDYRYCWLRDAFYTLDAFRMLGHYEEREQFIQFLLNVASSAPDLDLAPLYRIDGRSDLDEHVLTNWSGYQGEQPVRIGNGAAAHKQYDVYGEMVLALTPLFLDARFRDHVTQPVLSLVTRLARRAVAMAGQPDAGIWELRSEWRPQTFSSTMCWAAADRMSRIAQLHSPQHVEEFEIAATKIRNEILTHAVHPTRGCLVADYGGTEVDAALLQAITLRLLPATDPLMHRTVDVIREDLLTGGWLKRYRTNDGFGIPEVAFTLCNFWLIEALARLDRAEEANLLLANLRGVKAPLGLLSEDVDAATGTMWGNFPQAYSHVGLIRAAFSASPRWEAIGT